MKKKQEEVNNATRARLCRPLKGFAPKDADAKTDQCHLRTRNDGEDEAVLFRRAVSGVRRFDQGVEEQTDGSVLAFAADPSGPHALSDDNDGLLFRQAMSKIGSAVGRVRDQKSEDDQQEIRRSSSSRWRQLRRGTIRIAQELDLHGKLRDEALSRLEHFIMNASARGHQAVLVITGKGMNSPEGPVLQGAVKEWLRTRGKGSIAEFHPAPRDKGGSGAIVVFLKRRR